MNENNLNTNNEPRNTYRATTNLNIDMENPQMHMNSAIGMNIKDISQNSNFSPSLDDSFNSQGDFYKDYSNQPPLNQGSYHANLNQNNNFNQQNWFKRKIIQWCLWNQTSSVVRKIIPY